MALKPWQKIILEPYNRLMELIMPTNIYQTTWPRLLEVRKRINKRTDISSHLRMMFLETVKIKPKMIVELGVKRGESTYALSRAAMVTRAKLISVDIRDHRCALAWKKWYFVQMDDLEFASIFKSWCQRHHINPKIDVLFIDTSHEYEHTLKEIKAFLPHLSSKAMIIFHDTNCSDWYFRKNNTIDRSYDNKRQVARAIETFLNWHFDETKYVCDYQQGWLLENYPYCNGLFIMRRIKS